MESLEEVEMKPRLPLSRQDLYQNQGVHLESGVIQKYKSLTTGRGQDPKASRSSAWVGKSYDLSFNISYKGQVFLVELTDGLPANIHWHVKMDAFLFTLAPLR